MAESFGDRVALIRQSLGSVRTPLSQDALADLVTERARVDVDNSRLSRIESGTSQKFYEAVAILRALVELDPEKRGYEWLIGAEPLPLDVPKTRDRKRFVQTTAKKVAEKRRDGESKRVPKRRDAS
jgi:hypothetical protein